MSSPENPPTPEPVRTPTVSTAPTGGTPEPPRAAWWRWEALPHHLGRARTSTVILSVLFLAVFTLYLTIRPDELSGRSTPAGGGSDVEAPVNPVNPLVPVEPTTTPEPTEEPTPTTEPEETGTPAESPSDTPATSSTPSSTDPGTTEPTTGSSDPTETSQPSSPTDGTSEPTTSSPSTSG